MKELTQEQAARAAAEMLKVIHGTGARRVLPKLTKAQLGEVAETAEKEIALERDEKCKFGTAKNAMKVVQHDARQLSDDTGDDLRKRFDENPRDPVLAICDLHKRGGHPVIASGALKKGTTLGGVIPQGHLDPRMVKTMTDRFDHDRKES